MSNARVTRNQRGNLPRTYDSTLIGHAEHDPGLQLSMQPNAPEVRHKARLTVVWLAADADDARTLLDALGLL